MQRNSTKKLRNFLKNIDIRQLLQSIFLIKNKRLIKKWIKLYTQSNLTLTYCQNLFLNRKKKSQLSQIVNGQRAPLPEELKDVEKYLTPEELEKYKNHELTPKEIPEYWLKVLQNGDFEGELAITERDQEALKALQRIECSHSGKFDFTLKFYFKQNEFFSNTVLEKGFKFGDDQYLQKVTATKIEWLEGKNLTRKIVKKKQKNKKSGAQRIVSKEVDGESFFLFFRELELNEKEKEKFDEERLQELQEKIDFDQDIGTLIMDELIPYSIEYYLGIKQEEEEGEEGDKDDGKDKKGDDEDFSDEEVEAPKQKTKKK